MCVTRLLFLLKFTYCQNGENKTNDIQKVSDNLKSRVRHALSVLTCTLRALNLFIISLVLDSFGCFSCNL